MRNIYPKNSRLICISLLILAVTITIAALPSIARVAEPTARLTFSTAKISNDGEPVRMVRLPHSWPSDTPEAARLNYIIEFSLKSVPTQPQRLFIPTVRHHLTIKLNGTVLDDQKTVQWANLSRGYVKLLDIPPETLMSGNNRLELTLTRNEGIVPAYLSKIYIGDKGTIVTSSWFVKILNEQWRTITAALHLFIVSGLLTGWMARPNDAFFSWLAAAGAASLAVSILEFRPLPEIIDITRPWLVMTLSSFGLMIVGVALTISGISRPRYLIYLIVAIPLSLIFLYETGLASLPAVVIPSVIFAIGGHIVAGVVLIYVFIRQEKWAYGFLAIPFFLTAWFGMRDVAVAFGLMPGGFLLSTFVRPITYLGVLVLLMYKLASSLNQLDQTNDVLRNKLTAQETELSALHTNEKILVSQNAREHERRRLMHDLHDGLSGYLVSIIAVSEKHNHTIEIERMAREALEDLRLVVHSLNLGDTDLLLALAGFRERLAPRLRQLGVKLNWSMEALPEVQGLTPGNALSILRILQEATTNALKHGPAREICISGAPAQSGMVAVSVSNDRHQDMRLGKGHGLSNMQSRAQELGGYISTSHSTKRYELLLFLPKSLPED